MTRSPRDTYVRKYRASLLYQLRYAAHHPDRIRDHARRVARDAWLHATTRDHVAYYRAVMRDDIARNSADSAVGSPSSQSWLALGQLQFDYLLEHGLRPHHRLLDIGCGNLRAGWRFIDHLEPGNYHGVDISPDVLLAAQRTVAERGLQAKLPYLTLVDDLKLAFLPSEHFHVVHAHSVFSHSPLAVIEECLANVGRVLEPGGFFDFTFDRTETRDHHVLHEDFYYRTETLVAAAERHGLHATFMADWEDRPHKQSKIRVTKDVRTNRVTKDDRTN